jgi:NAD(P)-dependent dehydrogenase (short-subunit alcohol dehydrogenase family)
MGKNAMIWGAGGGIGRALASHLEKDGWRVLAMGRHTDQLGGGAIADLFEANVSDSKAIERALDAASEVVDEVDLWIYAAGDITASKVAQTGPDTWQRILDANLGGAYLTAHYSLPLLARDASMIFLGAISERMRLPRLAAYAAAKAGLEGFVEVLAKEERKRRIILVRPAAVDTPLWEKVPFKLPAGAMSPDEVAERILSAYHDGHRGKLDL